MLEYGALVNFPGAKHGHSGEFKLLGALVLNLQGEGKAPLSSFTCSGGRRAATLSLLAIDHSSARALAATPLFSTTE